jgi:hypothetical protein
MLVPGIFKIPGTMERITKPNQIITNLKASGILKIPETMEILTTTLGNPYKCKGFWNLKDSRNKGNPYKNKEVPYVCSFSWNTFENYQEGNRHNNKQNTKQTTTKQQTKK